MRITRTDIWPVVVPTRPDAVNSPDWGDDGYIYFEVDSGLGRIRATGGGIEPVYTIKPEKKEIATEWPQVLPGATGVLFRVRHVGQGVSDFEIMAAPLICFMAAQPVMGWLSDRVGRKRLLIGAFGIGALMAYPVFTAIAGAASATLAFAILFGALLVQSAYTSISAVLKAELFPTHVRALGVALPYALANALFGGTAEYVALRFKSIDLEQGFFVYVGLVSAIACAVSIRMRDTQAHSAIVED